MESNVKNKKQQAMPKSEAESFGIKKKVSIYDNTLTNFANNTVQNKSFGRYFSIHR